MPVWMLVEGALGWRERPAPAQMAGAALGFAGVCVALGRASPGALLGEGEIPKPYHAAAFALIVGGTVLSAARRPAQNPAP